MDSRPASALLEEIEKLRGQLVEAVMSKGIEHEDTMKVSAVLDQLIVVYERQKRQNSRLQIELVRPWRTRFVRFR